LGCIKLNTASCSRLSHLFLFSHFASAPCVFPSLFFSVHNVSLVARPLCLAALPGLCFSSAPPTNPFHIRLPQVKESSGRTRGPASCEGHWRLRSTRREWVGRKGGGGRRKSRSRQWKSYETPSTTIAKRSWNHIPARDPRQPWYGLAASQVEQGRQIKASELLAAKQMKLVKLCCVTLVDAR
jgi:hypothetical protein